MARNWLPWVLLCLAWLLALPASAAPRIGILTMQPGEVFFERFGHDAIVVADPDTGEATSYNFGYFDPEEPDFVSRFARGDMMYYLVALPLEQDLAQYRAAGRGASIQWLDLPHAQAQRLATDLAERARPENARYRYDYFTANCATQVRDALNEAMQGGLKSQLAGRSRGNSYRSESVRLARPAWWMWLGFDLGLGPYADRPLSRWDEGFVPMRLAESLREARNADGRPLVQSEQELLPHRIAAEPVESPRRWWPALLAGIALATGIAWLAPRRPRGVVALAIPLWLACGVGGLLLLYLWGATEHVAAWGNRNLLLLNPLCLLLLPGALQWLRGHPAGPVFRTLLWVVAGATALAWFIHWLPAALQYNQPWIAVLLPVHLSLAVVLTRMRTPVPTRSLV